MMFKKGDLVIVEDESFFVATAIVKNDCLCKDSMLEIEYIDIIIDGYGIREKDIKHGLWKARYARLDYKNMFIHKYLL